MKDVCGNWKFKLMSWKTIVAYLTLSITPSSVLLASMALFFNSNLTEYSNLMLATYYLFTFLKVANYIVLPVLLANFVEKSKVNMDTSNFTKKPLLILYLLVNILATLMALIGGLNPKVEIFLILESFHIFLSTICYTIILLTVNLVCNDFKCEVYDAKNIMEVHLLCETLLLLGNKLEFLKKGLSPILFFILTSTMIFCIVESYYISSSLLAGAHLKELIFMILTAIGNFVFIYFIIINCDNVEKIMSDVHMPELR